ncbi:MAG: ABC transporter permease subunit, partial [Christensenellaceae bacterium]
IRNRQNRNRYGFDNKPLGTDLLKAIGFSALVIIFVYFMNDYQGIPVPVALLFVLVLVLTFIAEKTVFGRSIYAIGGNVEAVRYAGINVEKNTMVVYVVSGITAAIAGIVLTARQAAGLPSSGQNMELDGIASAVIGGASMSGGIGRVYGAIIGALMMATIDNGMAMLNMETFWQYIVKGGILVAAVLFDVKSKSK